MHPPDASSLSDAEKSKAPRSTLVSRNVTIAGCRTSIRLEPDMWSGLSEICRRERGTLHQICTLVAGRKKENTSLTAAIRVFVMSYFRAAATEEGHSKAGHGYGAIFGAPPPVPLTRIIPGAAAASPNGKMDGARRF